MSRLLRLFGVSIAVIIVLAACTSPAPPGTPTSIPTLTPVPVVARVTTVSLNVRLGPSTLYPIITSISQGTTVTVLGQDSAAGWLRIRLPDGSTGWVARSFTDFSGTVAIVNAPPLPTATAVVAAGVAGSWRGEYYANSNLSGVPALTQRHFSVSFNWGRSSPSPVLPIDGFSARWTRTVNLPAGNYRFSVRSAGGARVWIDGALVVDEWRESTGATYAAERQLTDGEHTIRIDYFETQGDALIQFWWQRTGNFLQWQGEYYSNPNLSGPPVFTRNDRNIDFDWGSSAPDSRLPADNFSARWTRTLMLSEGLYRFRVISDDGVRLFVDGNLLVDAWQDGGQHDLVVEQKLPAGNHNLRVEYYERTGDSLIQVTWELVTAFPDWQGEYWANRTQEGNPALVRNDAGIDFNWGEGSPAGSLPADNFSARWTRTNVFEAGTYRFHALVDDGVRLWVDEQLVIDSWQDGGARDVVGQIALTGGAHTLRVSYYESTGAAIIRVWWERVISDEYPEWKGEYWANEVLSGEPSLVRNDPAIDFRWGTGSPATGLPTDRFSARWSRTVTFTPGIYRFNAIADDGLRFYLDGNLIINRWQDSIGDEVYSVELAISGAHRLVVEYYEFTGGSLVTFQWQRVGDLPTSTPTLEAVADTPTATVESPTSTPEAPTDTPTVTAEPPSPTTEPTTAVTDTPEPEVTATATSTPTVVATPALLGTVTGSICRPEGVTMSAIVFLQDTETDEVYTAAVEEDESTYAIELPAGSYDVYAWLSDFSQGGTYSGSPIVVAAGDALEDIDVCDWDGEMPPPPTVTPTP